MRIVNFGSNEQGGASMTPIRFVKRWRLFLLLLAAFLPLQTSTAAPRGDDLDVRERPQVVYSFESSSPAVRRTVRTAAGEALDVSIEARALGFSVNVDGASPLAIRSDDETLQTAVAGELNPDVPFVLMVSRRADRTQNVVI